MVSHWTMHALSHLSETFSQNRHIRTTSVWLNWQWIICLKLLGFMVFTWDLKCLAFSLPSAPSSRSSNWIPLTSLMKCSQRKNAIYLKPPAFKSIARTSRWPNKLSITTYRSGPYSDRSSGYVYTISFHFDIVYNCHAIYEIASRVARFTISIYETWMYFMVGFYFDLGSWDWWKRSNRAFFEIMKTVQTILWSHFMEDCKPQ